MNVEDFRDFCLSLGDDIEEKFPFGKFHGGDSILVFYTCGHMFCYFDVDDFEVITLKCQSERIIELKERYDSIVKPFNADERYWIGVRIHETEVALVKELVRNSYEIIKNKYSHVGAVAKNRLN